MKKHTITFNKKKYKYYYIKTDVLNHFIYIHYNPDKEKLFEEYIAFLGLTDTNDITEHRELFDGANGMTTFKQLGGSILITLMNNIYEKGPNGLYKTIPSAYGTLVHELLHAVFKVCSKKGIKYDKSSEEIYTSTISYLVQQVLEDPNLFKL